MNGNSNTPEKFWARVQRSNGCWLWTGTLDYWGYGCVGWHGIRNRRTHRIAAWLSGLVKDLDTVKHILHKCDTPACCRPDHLFVGNRSVNTIDCVKKGRHNTAKLNFHIAERIRLKSSHGISLQKLATQYGVHKKTIWMIVNHKYWKQSKYR